VRPFVSGLLAELTKLGGIDIPPPAEVPKVRPTRPATLGRAPGGIMGNGTISNVSFGPDDGSSIKGKPGKMPHGGAEPLPLTGSPPQLRSPTTGQSFAATPSPSPTPSFQAPTAKELAAGGLGKLVKSKGGGEMVSLGPTKKNKFDLSKTPPLKDSITGGEPTPKPTLQEKIQRGMTPVDKYPGAIGYFHEKINDITGGSTPAAAPSRHASAGTPKKHGRGHVDYAHGGGALP